MFVLFHRAGLVPRVMQHQNFMWSGYDIVGRGYDIVGMDCCALPQSRVGAEDDAAPEFYLERLRHCWYGLRHCWHPNNKSHVFDLIHKCFSGVSCCAE